MIKKNAATAKKVEMEKLKIREREEKARKNREAAIPKNTAVIIKAKVGESYAEILKNLKTKVGQNLIGVQAVRRSRGGDVILEISKDADADKIEKNIATAYGSGDNIRKLAPKISIEINNIDPTVDGAEIVKQIAEKLETMSHEVSVKSLKTTYSGNLRAIIEIPADTKNKIGDKITLGFTNCNVKMASSIVRCYRCHGFGHISYGCTEIKQGKDICRKCGREGHSIKDCVSESKCRLCAKLGLSEDNIKHVAGALSCPQYKKYITRTKSGTSGPSI